MIARDVWITLWDVFVICSIIPSIFLVFYQAFFNAAVVWHCAVIYTADAIYVVSIALRFCRSYQNHRGEIITKKGEVAKHYLRTSFSCDLLSTIPVELIAVFGNDKYVAALLRLNRTLRLYRIWTFLYKSEKNLGTNTVLLMSLRFLLVGVASIHFIAGVWFATACTNKALVRKDVNVCITNSWASHQSINWRGASDFEKYVVSLYWGVTTVTTVGYGDITPKLMLEKWVALVCMLWGVTLFGCVLGELASMLTNASAQRIHYIHRLNVIREQLAEAGVSQALRKKVVGFYEYSWEINKGDSGVTELFNQLPLALKAEVKLDSYRKLLEKSSLFKGIPEEFLRTLSLNMNPVLYLPRQVIVEEGEVDTHIYIVQGGEAEVLKERRSSPVMVLREGDIFGEGNMIRRTHNSKLLRARTHCNMLRISKGDILNILQHFPNVKERLEKNVKSRPKVEYDQLESDVSMEVSESEQEQGKEEEEEEEDVNASLLGKGKSQQKSESSSKTAKKQQKMKSIFFRPLMPTSKFLITWDLLIVLVTLLICWIYTYQAAFTHFNPRLGYTGSVMGRIVLICTYGLDFLLIVDILVSMKRAISTSTELVTKPRVILLHYVMSVRFALDVLAVLPLELFSILWMGEGQEWKYIPVFRLNRLLKLWKVFSFFSHIESSLHISMAYVTLLKYALYIFTVKHISACIWFWIACYSENSCRSNSWAVKHHVAGHTLVWQNYLISIYWSAATMTTVGYGEISAYNAQEMVVSMIVQLVGVMLYGYCLGAVAAILTNRVVPRVSFQEKMEAIHQFMDNHKMGRSLVRRMDRYLTLLWKQYNGIWYPGGEGLLDDMPQEAREDVFMKAHGALLGQVHLFKNTGPSFLRQLSVQTSLYLFAPGDFIMYAGDMSRGMYCIRKGHAEILSQDLFHVVRVLSPGNYFGDTEFLYGTPRVYTVRAATGCQLVMIKWERVEELLLQHPDVKKKIESMYSNFGLLKKALGEVEELDAHAMRQPKSLPGCSVTTALAVMMTTPLSVILGTSLASTVVACVGDTETQKKIVAPISVGDTPTGLVVRRRRRGSVREGSGRHGKNVSKIPVISVVNEDIEQAPCVGESSGREEEEEEGTKVSGPEHQSGKFFARCLFPCSVVPGTWLYYFWQGLSLCLVLLMAVTVSLQAAFLHRSTYLWALNYLLDVFFVVDMGVHMYMGYYDGDNMLVTQPSACLLHYLKTTFVLDMLSSFPTDFLVLFGWTSSIQNILRVLSLVRINRILKLYRVSFFFRMLEDQITTISVGPVKIVEFFIYMSVGTHLTACIWFMLACSSLSLGAYDPHVCWVDSWALQFTHNALTHYSALYQYTVSLYWATATTTTVGYGDIRAHTHQERAYATIIMVYGVVAYGYLIASVAANMVNADAGRAQYRAKLGTIKAYLQDYAVNNNLTTRVIKYYEYLWQRSKGGSFDALFQGMPPSLRADLSLSLYKPIIDQVPLFANTELGFTKLLALSLKPITFPSGEYIVRKEDIGTEMFFIYSGSVEIISEEGEVVFALMKEGQFFGEISLFFDCPRTASIRAATNTDLFSLSKTDLYRALSHYPHIRRQIRTVASKRVVLAKKRSIVLAQGKANGLTPSAAAKKAAKQIQGKEEGVVYYGQTDSTKSEASKESEEKKGCGCCKKALLFTIPHNTRMGSFLYWLGTLLSYYSFFTISYQAAFQDQSYALWIVNYLFEVYFLTEIFLRFHLTYEDKNGNVVTDPKSIVKHNFKVLDGFVMDCVTLFPYELLVLPIRDSRLRVAMVLYMRLPHLARVIRVKWMFDRQQRSLHQRTFLLQMCKSLVLVTMSMHSVACIWYFLGCRASICHKGSWVESTPLLNKTTPHSVRYGTSYYWAVTTMTTVGYGDITPTNLTEMMYSIVVMVMGKLLFGFILGTVASTLANLDIQRVIYEEKLKALMHYLKQQHVSSQLRGRVFRFFEFCWLRNSGISREDTLSDLPQCLRAQLALEITHHLLKEVNVFQNVDSAFLRSLSLTLKPRLFLPGEFIVQKGDVGYGMFFVYRGQVELVDESGIPLPERLNPGDSFGLKSLLFSVPVAYTARAITNVDIFKVKCADFASALKDHPQAKEKIQAVALEEYETALKV